MKRACVVVFVPIEGAHGMRWVAKDAHCLTLVRCDEVDIQVKRRSIYVRFCLVWNEDRRAYLSKRARIFICRRCGIKGILRD